MLRTGDPAAPFALGNEVVWRVTQVTAEVGRGRVRKTWSKEESTPIMNHLWGPNYAGLRRWRSSLSVTASSQSPLGVFHTPAFFTPERRGDVSAVLRKVCRGDDLSELSLKGDHTVTVAPPQYTYDGVQGETAHVAQPLLSHGR